MTAIVARILVGCVSIPLAAIVYFGAYMYIYQETTADEADSWLIAGLAGWTVLTIGWLLAWGTAIPWNRDRVSWLVVATAIAALLMLGSYTAVTVIGVVSETTTAATVIAFASGGALPLFWLLAVIVICRQTADERALALAGPASLLIVCPKCRYSVGGQREARCPECGTEYTIAELLAKQKHLMGTHAGASL